MLLTLTRVRAQSFSLNPAMLFSLPVMPIAFLAWMAGLMVVYTVLAQIMKVIYIKLNKEWV